MQAVRAQSVDDTEERDGGKEKDEEQAVRSPIAGEGVASHDDDGDFFDIR